MSLNKRRTEDLVRIAVAGGGMRLNVGSRLTDDLVRIAVAANLGNAKLYLFGLTGRVTEDLVRIAAAGKGAVIFEDNPS